MNEFKVDDWVVGKHNKNPMHIKTIGTTSTNSGFCGCICSFNTFLFS